jgi:hypothetical protein
VVPPFYATLATATMEMYQTFKRQGSSVDPTRRFMNNINKLLAYLSANHSILMDKKAIFIPINILDTHWCCSVAINAKAMLLSPEPAFHRCGFIYYDSLNSELETLCTKPPAVSPLFFLLDFLMVAYEGSENIKDGKKEVPKFRSMHHFDKWLCGKRGHPTFAGPTFDGNLLFPQLVLHKKDHSNFLIQRNGWDCGYYICIFLLDLAMELRENGLANFI